MFFFLSKILDVLLTPLAWATVLVLVGLTRSRSSRVGLGFAWLGLAVLLAFSLESVSNSLWHSLESPPVRTFRAGVTYDAVILLGGITEDRAEVTWGERSFNDSNERLLQTFDLLRAGTATNAIISCGAASPTRTRANEAHVLHDQLVAWGIAPERLVIEDEARNTHENAVLSAAIVRARGWKNVLIVTSAFHMARAYGCFVAEGLPVDTLPVDFRSFGSEYPTELLPRADHLAESTGAIREWFGRRIYQLRGYAR